jgi:hypothetical protein
LALSDIARFDEDDHDWARSVADAVVERSRLDLTRFFDGSSSQPSTEAAVENVLCEIFLGVMTRGAIFESLAARLEEVEPRSEPFPYVTPMVAPYSAVDGDHQFMSELTQLLDDGVWRYYQLPHTRVLRDLLQTSTTALCRLTPSALPGSQGVDTEGTGDFLRDTLRHNAETALIYVRAFAPCITSAYADIECEPPVMTVSSLQRWFCSASSEIARDALRPLGRNTVAEPAFRTAQRLPPERLVCHLVDGKITGFTLDGPNPPSRVHSNCPAASAFPGFTARQDQTIAGTRRNDHSKNGLEARRVPADLMSTAEALFRLASFAAPRLWEHNYEAHLLCPELWENANATHTG